MNILPLAKITDKGFEHGPGPIYFQTSKFLLQNNEQSDGQFIQIAKELSLITGRQIEFRAYRDNDCAVWGDYGAFIIK